MHHAPAGPPLFPRLGSALIRLLRPLRRFVVVRPRRAVPILLVSLAVAVLGLGVPVVSSDVLDRPAVALDASSSNAAGHPGGSLVRLGVDGDPAGGSAAARQGGSAGSGSPSDPGRPARPGPASPGAGSTAPGTGAVPGGSGSPAPAAGPGPSSPGAASADTTSPGTASPGTTSPGTTSPGTTAPGTAGSRAPASSSAATSAGTSSSAAASRAASGSATAAAASPATGTAAEAAVLTLVNQERAAAGCSALTASSGLAGLARAHSADMRDRGYFDHTDPDGRSPFDRGAQAGVTVLAENIARGQATAAAVMDAWMNSAGHRANILNCSYRTIGVGVANGTGGPWWTQEFA